MTKNTILYISPVNSSFVKSDLKFLEKKFKVHFLQNDWKNKFRVPFLLIWQLISIPFLLVSCKAIFVAFGGYWSFLPMLYGKIFGKPRFIILHGTDAASIPSLNYGNLRKPLLKKFCKWSYQLATKLLPVSESLIFTRNEFCIERMPESEQGIRAHFPSIEVDYEVIPNGFDTNFWHISDQTKKKLNQIITVFSKTQFYLKGGDIIIRAAEKLPDYNFVVVGCSQPKELEIPKNVIFKGRLSPEALRKEYQQSQLYLQLSCFEGFGCSLCEAMLCGCLPIGSDVNFIPEIIGNVGYIVESRNSVDLVRIIQNLTKDELEDKAIKASRKIASDFPLQKRESQLMNLLHSGKH